MLSPAQLTVINLAFIEVAHEADVLAARAEAVGPNDPRYLIYLYRAVGLMEATVILTRALEVV